MDDPTINKVLGVLCILDEFNETMKLIIPLSFRWNY